MPVEQQAMPADKWVPTESDCRQINGCRQKADADRGQEKKERKKNICPVFYRRLAAKKSFIKAAHSSASSPFTTTVFG